MSGSGEVARVYAAMEEAAGLLDVACSREKVWPILTAFEDVLADSVIVFSMASGRHATELDFSISVPADHGDPYAAALATGAIPETDHPVGNLLADTQKALPVSMFAVDGEVTSGFKKTYAFFPTRDMPGLAELIDIPSMPPSVAENADLFARYGLDKVQMISLDYKKRQVNLYFSNLNPEFLEAGPVLSMVREMGLHLPVEKGLAFAPRSFAVYPTLSWDSGKIERLCFAVISTDPTLAPAQDDADLAQFSTYANNAPYAYAGEKRTLVYGLTLSPSEEYYKLGSYYQISDIQRKLLKAFDSLAD
ncbi:aromatic prenyltransferase [Streptomyces sp. NBC_01198]|uniref:aromatic prenyltransferase n=1 Tax=Streptomyces sp. NBC_01198 TaxID=2903769 RepID=UPI002E152F2C|nr:aromatic prenyltransferase [Streptomyces sp. NBC_01198]